MTFRKIAIPVRAAWFAYNITVNNLFGGRYNYIRIHYILYENNYSMGNYTLYLR